jgi:hypothetical protein
VNNARGAIAVSFDPPDNDGYSDITRYDARCTSSNGGFETSSHAEGSPILVTGLTFGKSYECDAFATNEFGNGAFGPTAGPVTVDVAKPAPPNLVGWTLGQTSIAFDIHAFDDGYYLLTSKGSVDAFGAAKYKGDILSKRVTAVAMMKAPAPFSGYWILTKKGRIYALGGAPLVSTRALNRSDVVGMVVTSNGMRAVTTRRIQRVNFQ